MGIGLAILGLALSVGPAELVLGQAPQLPANYPKAQYDESKVPQYTLPDPLVTLDSEKVADIKTWVQKRRPEILKLFETHVYGRTMVGRPKEMTWEVGSEDRQAMEGKAITKTITLYFAGKKDGPKMNLTMTLPNTGKPAPVFMLAGGFGRPSQEVLNRGYGTVAVRIDQVQADNAKGYAKSIRKYFAPADQNEPGEEEWGAIGAWAWALSRAMDYVETDKDIDTKRVCLNGVSRFGKVVMWAGAQDERFAITFSGESGCGGAVIVRRQYGETVRSITGFAPYWFDRKFKQYADKVNELPVDWHMLVALHAPRPVYIATAEQDYWGDPRGSFLAGRNADPVYKLFGKTGVGVDDMPTVETPVGNFIGYHNRKGGHGQNAYDWQQFLNFADRHFGATGVSNGSSVRAEQGMYLSKKRYEPQPLPAFQATRDKLPSPVFDEDPNYVRCYWKAWELAFRNFHEPARGSGFVSQFIDAAFNQNIFLWDTCFMTMFCNYAHPYVPGIGSLDNFYIKQHEDGEICREINRTTGVDFEQWVNKDEEPMFSRWGYTLETGQKRVSVVYEGRPAPAPNPKLTLDALNHPIFAWAELESFRLTGDKDRLALVWEPLARYYAALQKHLRQGNGLYLTDWASMDNATRNKYLEPGGCGIDISCEMVLFARHLAQIADVLGKQAEGQQYQRDADELSTLINRHMWDEQRKFYFDLTIQGERAPVKSIAAFWALLAQVASKSQAEALAVEVENPDTFKTIHRVPTLAANEPGFDPKGGYWTGAVWAPSDKMVIAGLENYGYGELGREIAMNHLRNVVAVFKETGTIWENYAPQHVAHGEPAKGDFVGWSGIGPIAFSIEYAIGIRADALANRITWDIRSPARVGVERFWFGGKTVSLLCEKADAAGVRTVMVKSDGAFDLAITLQGRTKTVQVAADKETQVGL